VGSKTTESLIDNLIFLATKVVGMTVNIKDINAYQKELRNGYIINKELSNLAGHLALKCGRFLAAANAALITTKHIDLFIFAQHTMSTEQSVGETQTAHSQVDIAQQATNPAPTPREKNPKHVATGKLVAERTRVACEQQKKAAAEASVNIANNNAKQQPPPPDPAPTPAKENSSPLTITQWLMVGSIVVGLAGIYYKHEELKVRAKTLFGKKNA